MNSSRLFQIYEHDLVSLEDTIPALMEKAAMTCNDPLTRKQWQNLKEILSNVRWGYGPPLKVETFPIEGDETGAT
jgi:hypothetical protein